ncbi:MAG TPA: hypothetical protein P5136_00980 [Methanofastidiosum sp.]|nr:hypothetical protein [Methanofastidiosum sp.]
MQFAEVFIIGTIWFWILIGVVFLSLFFLVEKGQSIGATITLILTFVALRFLGNFDLLKILSDNIIISIIFFLSYIAIGIFWSFVKVAQLARIRNEEYLKKKNEYLKENVLRTEEDWLKRDPFDSFRNNTDISEYKKKIITWSAFWPWSVIWTIIDDPIMKLFKWIYSLLSSTYQKIFDKMAKSMIEDRNKVLEMKTPLKK